MFILRETNLPSVSASVNYVFVIKTFHLHFKQKVIEEFEQTWYNDVDTSRSLILYLKL